MSESDFITRLVDDGVNLYNRYRYHRLFTNEQLNIIHLDELFGFIQDGSSSLINNSASGVAYCFLQYIPFESDYFGQRMYRLTSYASNQDSVTTLIAMLQEIIQKEAAIYGPIHVSSEVDLDDYLSLNALVGAGFEILDVKRTYVTKKNDSVGRLSRRARAFDNEIDSVDEVLALFEGVVLPSRYSRDIYLNQEVVSQFYQKWMTNLLQSNSRDACVYVAEKEGRLVAAGGIKARYFPNTNISLTSSGVYAAVTKGVGSYPSILKGLINYSLSQHSAAETTVSLNNIAAARVLEKIGYPASTRYALRLMTS